MELLSLFLAVAVAAPSPSAAANRELRGRVLSEGRPVPGAAVVALPLETPLEEARREARFGEPSRELARATTGHDGTFVLRAPAGVDELRLQVSADGFVPVLVDVPLDGASVSVPVEARLARASSLAGTVLDAGGKPVVGATVTLWPGDEEPGSTPAPATATSGPDGRFRFGAASGRGNRLRVEAPGQAVVDLPGLRAGALRQAIRLQRGRSVEGVVLRPDQRPAAGALVRLEGPVTLRWVEAAANGAFRLDGLPPAPGGSLVAAAGDAGRARAAVPQAGAARLVLTPTATVRGRAVDVRNGLPVAGVRVGVVGPGGHAHSRSGPDGRFELRGLAAGRCRLGADEPRYAPWALDDLEVPAGGVVVRDLPLAPAAMLAGRVVDENGLPVADASGHLVRSPAGGGPLALMRLMGEGAPDFRSGPDGRFEAARLAAGSNVGLTVTHPDFESRSLGGLDLKPGRANALLEIVLRRGRGIAGIVKDARGEPLADVELRLSRSFEFTGGRGGMAVQFGFVGGPGARPEVRSGADGRFELRGLGPGDYSLQARKQGYATQRVDPVKLSDSAAPALEIVLPAGVTISGFVRDRSGKGLEGRRVEARLPGARGPGAGLRTDEPSASDGSFVIEGLAAGQAYEVSLMDLARPGRRGTPVVAPAEGMEIVASALGRIEGLAIDAESGRPLTDFAVSYEVRDRGGRIVFRGGSPGGALTPGEKLEVHDEEGRFALDGVPPGTWDVEVASRGYESGRAGSVALEEGGVAGGVEVRLRRGATLAGRVLEAGSARPVADAVVEAEAQGGEPAFLRFGDDGEGGVRTDADGRFEIVGLAPGSYSVSASHPDFAEAAETVLLKGQAASVELRLGRGSRLSGVVVSGGRPVPGASVALAAAGEGFGGPFGPGSQGVTSDDAGRFRFERLTPGRYTLTATLRGQTSSPVEAVLQGSGSRDDLVLELSGGAVIRGLVKGLPDAERGGVRVGANGPEQYYASARTNADGSFELAGAPVGPISLTARTGDFASGSRSASGQVVVPEGQAEVGAEIVFETGFRIDGRFTRAGEPVPEAHVVAFSRGGAGRSSSGSTDASGSFTLEGLAAGSYEVRASTFGQSGRSTSARQTVELRGDLTLDLEAPLGRLSGVVLEAETRRPIGGAVVELQAGEGALERAATDSAGRFELEDLDPGARSLSVRKPGYETATRTASVAESGSEITVELRRGEGIGLVVRDGIYGTPLRHVFVRVLDGGGASLFTGGVSLDGEGRGEVPGLAPGAYEVRADAASYAPVTARGVVVPAPALALALTPGGTLEVVSGPETLGRPGARARLLGADGLPYLVNIFASDGLLSLGQPVRQFENVAPGSYTLAVEGGPTRPVEVREGGTTRVELP